MDAVAFALPGQALTSARSEARARSASQVSPEREFERIYDANAAALLRYLARSTSDVDLAEDLLQDVFYRYVRAGFPGGSREHRRRFLFKIASNLVIDHYRRTRPPEADVETAPVASQPSDSALGLDLGRLMSELSLRDRQLLWLAHVEGFSHREIGHVLGLTTASVRPAVFRARKRLGEILDRHGIGSEVLST